MRTLTILSRPFAVVAALALSSFAPSAYAQQAPTPEEVQQAQARWSEGKAAFDSGNYEAARVAFKQAYTIFQHPAFLQNLGEAELRTGRMVEAARHLTLFLRASSTGSLVQREFAKKSLQRAAEKLGSLAVETNADEAEVRVDGEPIGVAPLAGLAWHVAPGMHVVTAHKDGYLDGTERVQVAAGPPTRVLVRLQRVLGLAGDTAAEKAPTRATPTTVGKRATVPLADSAPSSSAEARTVVLVSGAVLTAVAAGLGVGFTFRARDDSAARDHTEGLLPAPKSDVTSYCVNPLPEWDGTCTLLREQASRLRVDHIMQFVGFIGAGAIGAATVATFFVWQPSSGQGARLVPVAAPGFAGLQWSGSF